MVRMSNGTKQRGHAKMGKDRREFSPITGRAWRFGDNISTDDIISGVHLAHLRIEDMASFAFAALRLEFAKQVKPGDLVVGGRNFGIGSSREEAPAVLRTLGVGAVLAPSFARIFFRNAFNLGLPAVEVPALASNPGIIRDGDRLTIHLERGLIINNRTGQKIRATQIPPFLLEYIKEGGALPLLKKKISPAQLK